MTTAADLFNEIERDFIVPITRPEYDVLDTGYSAASTTGTVKLANNENLLPGAILDVNFELMSVLAYNENTRTATVKRAFLGSTGADADAGDLVRINPRFSSKAVLDAMTDELRSWDDRLFRVETEEVAFGASDVDAAASPSVSPWRVVASRKETTAADLGWSQRTTVPVRLTRSEPVGQFASGYALHLDRMSFGIATTLDVVYALPFDLTGLSSSSDLQADHGLGDGMLEILKWGAVWRLMAGRETTRADINVHGRPDVQQNVGAGVLLQEAASYKKLRDDAYDREVRKLLAVWPIRFAG